MPIAVIFKADPVSPAPLSEPRNVSPIPIKTCSSPAILKQVEANSITSTSDVKNDTIIRGMEKKMRAEPPIAITAYLIDLYATLLAWSTFPAPRLCPTRTPDAVENPEPGIKERDSAAMVTW